jgi:hypothetical protein
MIGRRHNPLNLRYAAALLFVLTVVASATAQVDTLRANPNAVKLRRLWMRKGDREWIRRVGREVGGLGDLNGDSLADYAVSTSDTLDVYLGARPAPSLVPSQSIPITRATVSAVWKPLLGDHWGTGHRALGFSQMYDLVIYRTESGRIPDTPALRLPFQVAPNVRRWYGGLATADLDHDGYDELLVASPHDVVDGVEGSIVQLFIYRGGPNFSLDTPAVTLRDFEANDVNLEMSVLAADFDNDGDRHRVRGGILQSRRRTLHADQVLLRRREPHRVLADAGSRGAHQRAGPGCPVRGHRRRRRSRPAGVAGIHLPRQPCARRAAAIVHA